MPKTISRKSMTQTDAKGKVLRAPVDDVSVGGTQFKWWKSESDEDLASNIQGTIKFLETHQGSRSEQLNINTRLYGNVSIAYMSGAAFARANSATPNPLTQRISFNLVSSVIDTLVAKIAKNKIVICKNGACCL